MASILRIWKRTWTSVYNAFSYQLSSMDAGDNSKLQLSTVVANDKADESGNPMFSKGRKEVHSPKYKKSGACTISNEHGCGTSKLYTPDALEMRTVFDWFDENDDGLICEDDLSLLMKKLGFQMTDEEVRSMLRSIDRNNDNLIDFDEFFSLHNSLSGVEIMMDQETKDAEKEIALRGAFSVFDKDNDGFISPSELQQVLLNLGLSEGKNLSKCHQMIENVDMDGNGKVDFNEFKVLMCSDGFQV